LQSAFYNYIYTIYFFQEALQNEQNIGIYGSDQKLQRVTFDQLTVRLRRINCLYLCKGRFEWVVFLDGLNLEIESIERDRLQIDFFDLINLTAGLVD
jgi:hypothetical protein